MNQKRIGLLYGGRSGEYEVSLVSAASFCRHLDRSKYRILPLGISKKGIWYRQNFEYAESSSLPLFEREEDMVSVAPGIGLFAGGKKLEVDFIFPMLHGTFGEDGTVQGLLELLDLPYAGAGVFASAAGMDKEKAKLLWVQAGLRVVPWVSVYKSEYEKNAGDVAASCAGLGLPLFVKPVCAGSSVGISKVKKTGDLHRALDSAFEYDERVLVEKAIDAREIECSLLGNDDVRVFAPGEVIPGHEFYDYEAKYIDPAGARFAVPADLPDKVAARIKETAVRAYRALDMKGMARLDFFVEKGSGELFINEINTIPGFTSISMFPRMCEAEGLRYPDLLATIIELGFERHKERENLRYSL